jgi:hypothetical protein
VAVSGSCDQHGNEPLGCIKGNEFLDYLSISFSRGISPMELVNFGVKVGCAGLF